MEICEERSSKTLQCEALERLQSKTHKINLLLQYQKYIHEDDEKPNFNFPAQTKSTFVLDRVRICQLVLQTR